MFELMRISAERKTASATTVRPASRRPRTWSQGDCRYRQIGLPPTGGAHRQN